MAPFVGVKQFIICEVFANGINLSKEMNTICNDSYKQDYAKESQKVIHNAGMNQRVQSTHNKCQM